MKTFTSLALILLLTFAVTLCRANLGETEAQCIARYGHEFDIQDNLGFDVIGDKAASFNLKNSTGTFVMHVIFLNGMAVLEKITSADSSRDISEDQKQALLASEKAGQEWSEQATNYRTDRSNVTSGVQSWLRSDGAIATCWMSGRLTTEHGWGEIDLSTKQYADAQRDLDRQNGAR